MSAVPFKMRSARHELECVESTKKQLPFPTPSTELKYMCNEGKKKKKAITSTHGKLILTFNEIIATTFPQK